MPIETVCQTCSRQLRIADEHAGKTARCPACQTIYTVPQAASLSQPVHWPAAASASPGGIDRWHLRTPDGLTYGPVARAELDQWLQQGRITAQSQVLCEAYGQWVFAAKLYPLLGATAPPASAPAPQATTNTYPYASQFADRPYTNMPYGVTTTPYREQHRGAAVLALAIVGLFTCDIISLIAVIMGISDLGKMSSGTMDPGGRGLTIAGLVIALVKLTAMVLFFLLMILANFL